MVYFGIIVLTFFLFITYSAEGTYYNPSTIFCGAFLALLLLYSFKLFGIYEIEDNVIISILVGCGAFCCGSAIYAFIYQKRYNINNKKIYIGNKMRMWDDKYRLMCVVLLIAIIIQFIYTLPSLLYLMQGASLYSLRYVDLTYINSLRPTIIVILQTYYALPILFISLPIACIELLCNKKYLMMLLSVIMIVLYFLSIGERMAFVYLITNIFISLLLFNRVNISHKQKKRIILVFIILLFVIYLTTALRSSGVERGDSGFISAMYRYILGTLPNYSQQLNGNFIEPLFQVGQVTLYGFYNLINVVKEIFTGNNFVFFEKGNEVWEIIRYSNVMVDSSQAFYNFCTTGFLYFYADYGWIGIVLFSLIYGLFAERTYYRALLYSDMKRIVIYMLIMFSLIMFVLYDIFSNAQFVLALIYILLFFDSRFKFKLHNN